MNTTAPQSQPKRHNRVGLGQAETLRLIPGTVRFQVLTAPAVLPREVDGGPDPGKTGS